MDKDKLNEAAVDGWVKYTPTVSLFNNIFTDAFKLGVKWLMTQPLSDRLTDEEKEAINGYYNNQGFNRFTREIADCLLVSIFGEDLFKEK